MVRHRKRETVTRQKNLVELQQLLVLIVEQEKITGIFENEYHFLVK